MEQQQKTQIQKIDFNELARVIDKKYKDGTPVDYIADWVSKTLGKRANFNVVNFFLHCTNSFIDRDEDIVYDYYNNNINVADLALKYDTSQQEVYRVISHSPEFLRRKEENEIERRNYEINKKELANGEAIIKDYKKNIYTLKELSEKHGWSSTRIRDYLIYKKEYNFMKGGRRYDA